MDERPVPSATTAPVGHVRALSKRDHKVHRKQRDIGRGDEVSLTTFRIDLRCTIGRELPLARNGKLKLRFPIGSSEQMMVQRNLIRPKIPAWAKCNITRFVRREICAVR